MKREVGFALIVIAAGVYFVAGHKVGQSLAPTSGSAVVAQAPAVAPAPAPVALPSEDALRLEESPKSMIRHRPGKRGGG